MTAAPSLHARDGERTSNATLRDRVSTTWRRGRGSRALPLLAALLLPIPFLLVAHQLYFWDIGPFDSPRWAVNSDRSFIEIFGYLQLAAAVVLLLLLWARHRRGLFAGSWAVVLAVVVLDDSLRLHERGGAALVDRGAVPSSLGLPAQALGELAVWAALGVAIVILLALVYRASDPADRFDSRWLAGLMLLLVFFGVGVDVAHEVVEELTDNSVVDLLVTFVEAGGELAAMSTLLVFVVHMSRRSTSRSSTS